MKSYRIKIILQSGTTSHYDIINLNDVILTQYSYGYYEFKDKNNKISLYPISYTIVEEL